MKYHHLYFLCGLMFLLGASHVDAYTTTKQEAFTLDGNTAFFIVEYKFGHEKHDIHLPVLARESRTLERDAVSYEILDESGSPVQGTASGIVLSNAPYKDGGYHTKTGIGRTFTLFVAFTPGAETPTGNYHLQVTGLPFSFNGTQALQLNPSELQYYKTPSVTLQ